LTSGIFTAPRPGIYFFSFTETARLYYPSPVNLNSRLFLNGNVIGMSNVQESYGFVNQDCPVTIQSTLNLKKGDQLWVTIDYSVSSSHLFDDSYHYTLFTGFMLEEDIAASL
jgi:hypothetical protein